MTDTKRTSPQGSRVIDLTEDSPLVDENPPELVPDVPGTAPSRSTATEGLGWGGHESWPDRIGTVGEQKMGERLGGFMRDRPWLSLGLLALIGFLVRRALPRPEHQVVLPYGTLIEIPPGSRLRAVDGRR